MGLQDFRDSGTLYPRNYSTLGVLSGARFSPSTGSSPYWRHYNDALAWTYPCRVMNDPYLPVEPVVTIWPLLAERKGVLNAMTPFLVPLLGGHFHANPRSDHHLDNLPSIEGPQLCIYIYIYIEGRCIHTYIPQNRNELALADLKPAGCKQ